jgi:hypothetical protein
MAGIELFHVDVASWRMFLAKLLASPLIVGELRELIAETAAVSRTTVAALGAVAQSELVGRGQRLEFEWLQYAAHLGSLRACLALRLQFGPMTGGRFVFVGVDAEYDNDTVRELIKKLQPSDFLAAYVREEHYAPAEVECIVTGLPEDLLRSDDDPRDLFMMLMMNNHVCKHAIAALVC